MRELSDAYELGVPISYLSDDGRVHAFEAVRMDVAQHPTMTRFARVHVLD